MNKRAGVAAAIAIAVVVVAALTWWQARDRGATPLDVVTTGSADTIARTTGPGPASGTRGHLSITVTDEHGPVANAAVRLAPGDDTPGEIVVLRTGGDGRVRSGELAIGDWHVSASADAHAPAAIPTVTLRAGADERVTIVLVAGGRALSGTITDATGGPIAGARIDAAVLDARARAADAVATTTSGSDGRYRMTVAGGQLQVAVSDPDYAPVSRYIELGPAGATADFALIPGGAIDGIVRDEQTHEAVAGAKIEVRRDGAAVSLAETGVSRAVTAGADGKFHIAGLSPGRYELRAIADVRCSRTAAVLGLGVADQHTGVELLIARAPVVRGVVVDELGAPVGGAKITVDAPTGHGDATATPTGTFELDGLAPGRYVAFASTPTELPAGVVEIVIASRDIEGIELRVRRGAEVRGHVEPRQVATITLAPAATVALGLDDPTAAPITTAADGEFSFHPVAPGLARLHATTPVGDSGDAAITVGKDAGEVVVQIASGSSIAGRVVDASGKPIAAVTIVATATTDDQLAIVNGVVTSGTQALSGADGAFELRGLGAGEVQLRVLDRGKPLVLRGKPESATVSLAAGEHKTGVELAVDRASGKIVGTVLGVDGAPVPDAWVSAHQSFDDMIAGLTASGAVSSATSISADGTAEIPPVLTDATGHFEIDALTHGRYQVVAEAAAGKLRGRAADVTPDATVTIHLVAPTTLTGIVHGVTARDPAFDVALTGPTVATRSFTDPGGAFSFTNLDAGAYTLHVTSAAGDGDGAVTVVAGQPATVDITLVASATVLGRLVDDTGAVVAGLPVTVVPSSRDGKLNVMLSGVPPTSGPDGTFRLSAPAGDSVLVVLSGSRPTTRGGLELVAGQTTDLGTIVVGRGGSGSSSP